MRDAGNAAPYGPLTGIFGQQVHLSSQFVLIHARSPSRVSAAAPRLSRLFSRQFMLPGQDVEIQIVPKLVGRGRGPSTHVWRS